MKISIIAIFLATFLTSNSYAGNGRVENLDGSVTITEVEFNGTSSAGTIKISSTSNERGVCRLFKFDKFVTKTLTIAEASTEKGGQVTAAKISKQGFLKGFVTDVNEWFGTWGCIKYAPVQDGWDCVDSVTGPEKLQRRASLPVFDSITCRD